MKKRVFSAEFKAERVLEALRIVGFSDKQDAIRVLEVLPRRFGKFELTVPPEKIRLVPFNRPRKEDQKPDEECGTFDFLGFTHYWGRSIKGNWVVKRKTVSKRLSSKIQGIAKWCRDNRHLPIRDQHKTLWVKLQGHYQYYGINGNYRILSAFRHAATRLWLKWLNRRTRKGKRDWDSFKDFLKQFPLPTPKIMHSNI